DKSSDSKTTGFASCVSSVKSSSSKTNEPLASAPSSVAFQTMSENADQQPSSVVDGKVNVDTDGDGIGYVCDGFCEVFMSKNSKFSLTEALSRL
ncbi:hypothetical protein Tco_0918463, partial [Tanacetum coccineum]